ncbi:MAG TPA: hypothetical protein VNM16_12990 [Bacillota bacterium]|nr:hypothetical protein [Bacillota bacterium]
MAARGVASVFLYTREAHPGEQAPHHTSLEDKLALASRFQARWQIARPILVDDLDGPLHRAYGTLPNMTHIVSPGGRILYRAAWTDAASIEWALEYLLREAEERRSSKRVAPFYSELRGFRAHDDYARTFMRGLLAGGGRQAAEEFVAATATTEGPAAGERLRRALEDLGAG